jgi:hypothetical protein
MSSSFESKKEFTFEYFFIGFVVLLVILFTLRFFYKLGLFSFSRSDPNSRMIKKEADYERKYKLYGSY